MPLIRSQCLGQPVAQKRRFLQALVPDREEPPAPLVRLTRSPQGSRSPPLTPAEQAARKLWLRSNGERERDDRASFGSQQYGWDAEDGADSVVHMRAARRKATLATNVVLPAEVAAELEHDAARQAQIEVEVMASRDEHGDMSRLAGAERFKDVWGEDTP